MANTGVDGALRDPSWLARVRRQLGGPTVMAERQEDSESGWADHTVVCTHKR